MAVRFWCVIETVDSSAACLRKKRGGSKTKEPVELATCVAITFMRFVARRRPTAYFMLVSLGFPCSHMFPIFCEVGHVGYPQV